MRSQRRMRLQRVATRATATLCFIGAVACIIVVAVGGSFPSYKHGTSIVAPRTGDVWQVGELHTVQWTLNGMKPTSSSGDPIMAIIILSYSGDGPNSHVQLGRLTDWFPISDRLVNVMVPSVPTGNEYALYMFSKDNHDISSWSGSITIFNPDDVEGSEEPPNTLVVTTAPPISVTISLESTFSDSALTPIPTANATSPTGSLTGNVTLSGSATASNSTMMATATGSVVSATPVKASNVIRRAFSDADLEVRLVSFSSSFETGRARAPSPSPTPAHRIKRMRNGFY